MLEQLSNRGFDVLPLHHAAAILQADMPQAITEIEMTLSELSIPVIELVAGGGGEAKLTQWMRKQLAGHGWIKRNIEIKKYIDGTETMSLSHEIDHMKTFGGWVAALEIEWNNKDPFFDRDLENFKRLHAEGAISVGIIITRGSTLQLEMRDIIRRLISYCSSGLRECSRFLDAIKLTWRRPAAKVRAFFPLVPKSKTSVTFRK
ncbi:MAG: BglII/BstYI family type II restriction endonuclease [Dongiaceae bacterium]